MNWRGSHAVHSSNLSKGSYFIETTSNIGLASPLWSGHSHNLCCNHCYDFSLWGHCLIFTLSDLCCPPIQETYSSQGRWQRLSTSRNTVRSTLSGAPSELPSFVTALIQPGAALFALRFCFTVTHTLSRSVAAHGSVAVFCWSTSQEWSLGLIPVTVEASGIRFKEPVGAIRIFWHEDVLVT